MATLRPEMAHVARWRYCDACSVCDFARQKHACMNQSVEWINGKKAEYLTHHHPLDCYKVLCWLCENPHPEIELQQFLDHLVLNYDLRISDRMRKIVTDELFKML